jgi:hypothetical protein
VPLADIRKRDGDSGPCAIHRRVLLVTRRLFTAICGLSTSTSAPDAAAEAAQPARPLTAQAETLGPAIHISEQLS